MTTDKGLMVWLPLTDANHCENLGLVGKLTCITTPTFVDGGKLGKCLSTGEYLMSAVLTTKVFNNNHLTIAFWVYIDAATGASTPRSEFIGNIGMGANNNRKFMITLYPTVNDLHYMWMNDATSKFFIGNTIENVLPSYKWTHVAITYENPTAIIYINGVEVRRDTGVSNSSTFAYTTPIIKNNTGRRINDFRVYSYALSPQEIKELSRGKIVHYPCDTNDCLKVLWGDPTLRTTVANSYQNYKVILLQGGKTYTLRFQAKSSAAKNNNGMLLLQYCKTATSGRTDPYNTWVCVNTTTNYLFYETTFTTPIDHPYFMLGRRSDTNTIGGISTTIKNVIIMSPPAFLSDISGFGRHGQVVGNITLAGDTPRYDKSLKYNGGNVVVTGLPTMSTYTISWWDKFPANTGLLFDWRLGPVDTTLSSSSAGIVINSNTCLFKIGGITTDYLNYSNYNITANTWYHCCLVCDDSKSRLYINGILKWEASKGSIADFSLLILGGRNAAANDGYLYTGQHSDFRIYATALSADDVKELYSLGH